MPNSMIDFLCPVCGSEENRTLHENTLLDQRPAFNYDFTPRHNLTYRILKCLKCTHAYASPRHEDIWQEYTGVEDSVYLSFQEARLENSSRIVEYLHTIKPSGKLLDVGCATGDFLSAARKYYEVEGLELSEWSSTLAKEKEFPIHTVLLDHMNDVEGYDIITLWGVIEHFEFPDREIANIVRLLKPGGIVVLWTGDIDSVTSRILGRKWWYHQGQHIQMFSKRSLRALFMNQGFTEVKISIYPYLMSMRSIAISLRRYSFLSKIAECILLRSWWRSCTMTIALPGEMLAVFRKN